MNAKLPYAIWSVIVAIGWRWCSRWKLRFVGAYCFWLLCLFTAGIPGALLLEMSSWISGGQLHQSYFQCFLFLLWSDWKFSSTVRSPLLMQWNAGGEVSAVAHSTSPQMWIRYTATGHISLQHVLTVLQTGQTPVAGASLMGFHRADRDTSKTKDGEICSHSDIWELVQRSNSDSATLFSWSGILY